jgi:hypothetical protein
MGLLMFGVFFTLPLYFQAVQGHPTLGTGLRLLPLIAGLLGVPVSWAPRQAARR